MTDRDIALRQAAELTPKGSPERLELFYWEEMRAQDWMTTAGKPEMQRQNHINVWTAIIAHVRKPYEQELERLREENRMLKAGMLQTIEADA
jgi:hypothetical protein